MLGVVALALALGLTRQRAGGADCVCWVGERKAQADGLLAHGFACGFTRSTISAILSISEPVSVRVRLARFQEIEQFTFHDGVGVAYCANEFFADYLGFRSSSVGLCFCLCRQGYYGGGLLWLSICHRYGDFAGWAAGGL